MPIVRGIAALPTALALLALAALPPVVVQSQEDAPHHPPPGYYSAVAGLGGQALRAGLHEIIGDHQRQSYDRAREILASADEDPANPANVLTIYKNASVPKTDYTAWHREHAWPKSYGFPDDNRCNYPYTDAHHLFAANPSYNSSRSNKLFDFCLVGCADRPVDGHPDTPNRTATGIWEVWPGRRGDVARALLYMDVRYAGTVHAGTGCDEPNLILTDDRDLVVVSGTNAPAGYMGVLGAIVAWHLQDEVDDRERRRNEVVYGYQANRNPFVDHPEWVCRIWDSRACPAATPTENVTPPATHTAPPATSPAPTIRPPPTPASPTPLPGLKMAVYLPYAGAP